MDIKNIPVRVIGPGSQRAADAAETPGYIAMPNAMSTYQEPRMPEPCAVIGRLGAREAMRWLGQALRFYVEFHRGQEHLDGCVVNDPLTLGELIVPGMLTLADRRLIIDLDDGEHRGHTKEDHGGWMTTVALGVDVMRMRALLERVFGDGWYAPES